MKAAFYQTKIIEIVNHKKDMAIKLLSRNLEEADQAKQLLRDKGYGWIGVSLLETIKKFVPEQSEKSYPMLLQHIKADIQLRIKELESKRKPTGLLSFFKYEARKDELERMLKIIEKYDNLQPGMFS